MIEQELDVLEIVHVRLGHRKVAAVALEVVDGKTEGGSGSAGPGSGRAMRAPSGWARRVPASAAAPRAAAGRRRRRPRRARSAAGTGTLNRSRDAIDLGRCACELVCDKWKRRQRIDA